MFLLIFLYIFLVPLFLLIIFVQKKILKIENLKVNQIPSFYTFFLSQKNTPSLKSTFLINFGTVYTLYSFNWNEARSYLTRLNRPFWT